MSTKSLSATCVWILGISFLFGTTSLARAQEPLDGDTFTVKAGKRADTLDKTVSSVGEKRPKVERARVAADAAWEVLQHSHLDPSTPQYKRLESAYNKARDEYVAARENQERAILRIKDVVAADVRFLDMNKAQSKLEEYKKLATAINNAKTELEKWDGWSGTQRVKMIETVIVEGSPPEVVGAPILTFKWTKKPPESIKPNVPYTVSAEFTASAAVGVKGLHFVPTVLAVTEKGDPDPNAAVEINGEAQGKTLWITPGRPLPFEWTVKVTQEGGLGIIGMKIDYVDYQKKPK
jgi:hypothetical protein